MTSSTARPAQRPIRRSGRSRQTGRRSKTRWASTDPSFGDSRENVFLDGKSNLVLRATRDGNDYFGGLVSGNWRGGLGTTWEARIKLNCLTGGCWPAWWLSNDFPGREGEVDLLEWYGNGEWPAGTTVHADSFGTAFETRPIGVDGGWHRSRVTWNQTGFYFWEDYADGMEPYFSVPATGIEDLNDPIRRWPFNDPDYNLFAVLNLAVGGSGGGDPASGSYPAEMLIDWVRVS
jgi:beta-glucanase (GH16 family)